jgi:hypothetical protein
MLRVGFAALLTLPLLTACTSSIIDLREHLDVHRSSFEERLAGDSVKVEQFLACTQQAHDGTSLPLSIATDAPAIRTAISSITIGGRLRAPVQVLVERIRDRTGSNAASLSVFSDMAGDFADPLRRRLDLNKLRLLTDIIRQWPVRLDFNEDALAQDTALFNQLLIAYNKAYFGDLTFSAAPDAATSTSRESPRSLRAASWIGTGAPFGFRACPPPFRSTPAIASSGQPRPSTPDG